MSEWATATDPEPLIRLVWPRPPGFDYGRVAVSELRAPEYLPTYRRLRLLSVAYARQVWDLLSTDERNTLLVSERYADGDASIEDLCAVSVQVPFDPMTAQQLARAAAGAAAVYFFGTHPDIDRDNFHSWEVIHAAGYAARAIATRIAGPAPPGSMDDEWQATWDAAFRRAQAAQADLVREVFLPPGSSPALNAEWRTSAVVTLARQMYESRDFGAMPILADALQDAGCEDADVLGHCRGPGPHVRGCWVVDLVLGKG